MIDLGSVAGLQERDHVLRADYLHCDRWRVIDLGQIVGRGHGTSAQVKSSQACVSGYVWRTARPDDLACVTLESRSTVAEEKSSASLRWIDGPYGPHTCVSG